jgi:hypothetical protein
LDVYANKLGDFLDVNKPKKYTKMVIIKFRINLKNIIILYYKNDDV